MAGILRGRTWGLIAGVVLFTALAAWFAQREERGREDALEPETVDVPKPASNPHAPINESVLAADRDATPRASVEAPPPIAPAIVAVATIRGLAVDVEGKPLADLLLVAGGSGRELRTDANGEFDATTFSGRLKPAPPWVLVRSAQEQTDASAPMLVVAEGVQIAGHVETPDGKRLAGVHVGVSAPVNAFHGFSRPLDRTRDEMEDATSADDGSFAFLSPVLDSMLHARLDGYVEFSDPAPDTANLAVTIVMKPVEVAKDNANTSAITGVVVHPDQSPASGALVHFGEKSTRSADDGTFRIPSNALEDVETALIATYPGRQAAVIPRFGETANHGFIQPVRLVLGPPPLSIAGRVVDAKGEPKMDFEVALFDGTVIDTGHIPPVIAEAEHADHVVPTQKDGSFALNGLLDREYRLQVWSSKEMTKLISAPVRAGRNDVEIVVPASAHIAKLEGRVVGRDGRGVSNVSVRAAMIIFRDRNGYSMEHSEPVNTDDKGAFSIANVSALDGFLDFNGDEIVPKHYEYEGTDTSRPIVVEVERRCHFRIEGVPQTSGAKNFGILDARGERLQIRQFQEGGWMSSTQFPLSKGGTAPLSVSEIAATVVFLDEKGAEVARRPVSLVPGQVTPISW